MEWGSEVSGPSRGPGGGVIPSTHPPPDMKKGPKGPFTTRLSGRDEWLWSQRLHGWLLLPGARTDERHARSEERI